MPSPVRSVDSRPELCFTARSHTPVSSLLSGLLLSQKYPKFLPIPLPLPTISCPHRYQRKRLNVWEASCMSSLKVLQWLSILLQFQGYCSELRRTHILWCQFLLLPTSRVLFFLSLENSPAPFHLLSRPPAFCLKYNPSLWIVSWYLCVSSNAILQNIALAPWNMSPVGPQSSG